VGRRHLKAKAEGVSCSPPASYVARLLQKTDNPARDLSGVWPGIRMVLMGGFSRKRRVSRALAFLRMVFYVVLVPWHTLSQATFNSRKPKQSSVLATSLWSSKSRSLLSLRAPTPSARSVTGSLLSRWRRVPQPVLSSCAVQKALPSRRRAMTALPMLRHTHRKVADLHSPVKPRP
jgi:hypothetical protein